MFRSILRFRNNTGLWGIASAVLWAASLAVQAQPPAPKGPRIGGEAVTIRGTVREFTTALKGEKDGLVLTDGTWVHWPPHLENRFGSGFSKGDKVKVIGFMETGPKGDTKLEVSTLTNLDTNRTFENPDLPAPFAENRGAAANGGITVNGTVKEFTAAPKGEVDGFILSDGKEVHWPPHLADQFKSIVARGDRVRATGFMETGPKGDSKLEVSVLTNLGTNRSVENPDRATPDVDRPPVGTGNRDDRLQELENQIRQLMREIQRLRDVK
jgi:hypothetical protein